MTGLVAAEEYGFFRVHSATAPSHLQDLLLRPYQMKGAKIGDSVVLEYHVSPSSGLWNVVEVIKA